MPQNLDTNQERPTIWVGHIELRVSNLKASLEFFKCLGMREIAKPPGIRVLELRGGTHLILREQANAEPLPASFDLMVDDLELLAKRLKNFGYTTQPIRAGILHQTFEATEPSGHVITFYDTHVVGLV